jgi:predicted aldo/keto reductase-like oxidoreductase
VQFPLSYLSSEEDLQIVSECKTGDIGLLAMKALSGGLITNAAAAFAFLRQYDNVLPLWGIQSEPELDEFLLLESKPREVDDEMRATIQRDRAELGGNFCRGCGYCMPCPVGIPINFASRMAYILKRLPNAKYLEAEWYEKMNLIRECTACGQCMGRCPYHLEIPALLQRNLAEYLEVYEARGPVRPL